MFQFHLRLTKKSDNLLILSLSLGYRILFCVITLSLGWGMLSLRSWSWISLILTGLSFLALMYKERWTFDKTGNRVTHSFGLLLLFRKKTYSPEEIEKIELKKIIRGKQGNRENPKNRPAFTPAMFITLNMIHRNGNFTNIETVKTRNPDIFRQKGEVIAEFLDKPFTLEE